MDLLKKELERKKKALQLAKQSETATAGRFLKAGELRRLQEEREEEERQKRKREAQGSSGKKRSRVEPNSAKRKGKEETRQDEPPPVVQPSSGQEVTKQPDSSVTEDATEPPLLTPQEVTSRFRSLGLPIRLFGEITKTDDKGCDDSARLRRLQTALERQSKTLASLSEMEEYRLGRGHGIRNPFLEKDDTDTKALAGSMEKGPTDSKEDASPEKTDKESTDKADDSSDPHKRIYKYFKGLIKEWEEDLAHRPEDVKRSLAGKNETKTLKQCKDYIRPLFKQCKNRRLEEVLLANLIKIVDYCQQGEFVKAHDAYMDVAIGRAAWPIGVTAVGIHARTGRSKIESQNVAHVMNSELQRKYLTSVKRLMSYAQKKRTDVDPSKKVMC